MGTPRYTLNIAEDYKTYIEECRKRYAQYELGMETIRGLCACHPRHSDTNVTISKLWLIGRSHAAALERTPVPDDEVYPKTAELMRDGFDGMRLDERLAQLNRTDMPPSFDDWQQVVDTVEWLASVFKKTTSLEKVSLASKYLHFHAPIVPIYDSISRTTLDDFIGRDLVSVKYAVLWERDGYGRYVGRIATAIDALRQKGIRATPRDVDIFLQFCP